MAFSHRDLAELTYDGKIPAQILAAADDADRNGEPVPQPGGVEIDKIYQARYVGPDKLIHGKDGVAYCSTRGAWTFDFRSAQLIIIKDVPRTDLVLL